MKGIQFTSTCMSKILGGWIIYISFVPPFSKPAFLPLSLIKHVHDVVVIQICVSETILVHTHNILWMMRKKKIIKNVTL